MQRSSTSARWRPCHSIPLSSWLRPSLTSISARCCSMLEIPALIMCLMSCTLTGERERKLLLKVIVSCGEIKSSYQPSSENVLLRSYTRHLHKWFAWKLLLTVSHVWWPGLDQEIEDYAKSCAFCQVKKHGPPRASSLASLGMANGSMAAYLCGLCRIREW